MFTSKGICQEGRFYYTVASSLVQGGEVLTINGEEESFLGMKTEIVISRSFGATSQFSVGPTGVYFNSLNSKYSSNGFFGGVELKTEGELLNNYGGMRVAALFGQLKYLDVKYESLGVKPTLYYVFGIGERATIGFDIGLCLLPSLPENWNGFFIGIELGLR